MEVWKACTRGRSSQVRHIESIKTLSPASIGCQVLPASYDVIKLLLPDSEPAVIATNPPLIGFTSQATIPSFVTTAQVSPLSVDLIIFLVLIASSTPSLSAKCPTRLPSCTCFQVFPLSVVLKKPLSVPMKIAPPAVSKA